MTAEFWLLEDETYGIFASQAQTIQQLPCPERETAC
jgi:hypothetical protein